MISENLNELPKLYSIFVVANKIDSLDTNSQKIRIETDKNEIERIEEEFPLEIKYFSISNKLYSGISDLFSEILNSLFHPKNYLYKKTTEGIIFSENLDKALKRLFRILDSSRKGKISLNEFAKIHENIFGVKLEAEHFLAIKECIKFLSPEEDFENLTESSFILLNKLSIQIGESQTTWSILRKYGYSDELELDKPYYNEKKFEYINLSEFQIDLTKNVCDLLTGIFNQFKVKYQLYIVESNLNESKTVKVPQYFLSVKEWENIFSTLPNQKELNFKSIYADENKKLELNDWLSFWHAYLKLDYFKAYQTFLYLGFDLNFNLFTKKIKKSEMNLFQPISFKTISVAFITLNMDNITSNNFNQYFENYFTINIGNKNFIITTQNYTIIVSLVFIYILIYFNL
jgi:Ras family protein T1